MQFRTKILLTCLLLAASLAFAQVAANNLVSVNLSNINTDIAKNLTINVSQVPVTVQAPIDVAAAACGISVDVLTSQVQQGNNKCTATTDTSAINTIVQNQLQKK